MRLFVGCSSSEDIPDKYFLDCKKFLSELFEYEIDLVFGACGKGLMGLAYDTTKESGGNVLGIYPKVYKGEVNGLDCEKIMTNTVPERTDKVISESDALLFLPGGFGTIYELLTAIECRRAYEFAKPIILYNVGGYFDKLFEFFELLYDNRFASRNIMDYYYVCDSAKDMVDYIDRYYSINTKKREIIKK